MTKQDDVSLISHLDGLTRTGNRHQALRELAKLLKSGVQNPLRAPLAKIANRNHAHVLAMRILHPIMRADLEGVAPASDESLNIYATSLMWIGALEESEKFLRKTSNLPDAMLTEAFLHFARWDYTRALPVLKNYIASPSLNDYQILVGEINLLAAEIAVGNLQEASVVAEHLLPKLSNHPNAAVLYGNALELRAQIEILRSNFSEALNWLDRSEKVLSAQAGRYLLYVNKWRAISHLGLAPSDPAALAELQKVRDAARTLRNWETVRDCDLHRARLTNDAPLLQRVLLGTPYRGYHERALNSFGVKLGATRILDFCPENPTAKTVESGWNLDLISDLSFLNSTSRELLRQMTLDIYRPPRMGVVFSALYNESFDPFTSPQRVRNSVFRFNDWTTENSIPFRIKIIHGDFILSGPSNVSVSCTQRKRVLSAWAASLTVFKRANNSRSFSTQDVADTLGISSRSARSIIHQAFASGKLQKISTGRASRYIFFSGRNVHRAA